MLSTCKDIDTLAKESDNSLSRIPTRSKPLKIEEMRPIMRARFYAKLSKICTDSILADLLEPVLADSKGKKKKDKPEDKSGPKLTLIQPAVTASAV